MSKLKKTSVFVIIILLTISVLFLGCSKPSEMNNIQNQQMYLNKLNVESEYLKDIVYVKSNHLIDFLNGDITKEEYQEKTSDLDKNLKKIMNKIDGLGKKLILDSE